MHFKGGGFMHTNTPRMGNWSLRNPQGEYVVDAKAIFAFASFDSETLRGYNIRLAGKTEVSDPHDEDPYTKMTTSTVFGVKSHEGGLLEVITDRYHEYIVEWSGVDPAWKEAIEKAGDGEENTLFRLIESKTVKKKASKEAKKKAANG